MANDPLANVNGAAAAEGGMSTWNRGHIVGQKPPLKPREDWSIRTRLQISGATRDLALFNLAVDSKLRGCNLAAL